MSGKHIATPALLTLDELWVKATGVHEKSKIIKTR